MEFETCKKCGEKFSIRAGICSCEGRIDDVKPTDFDPATKKRRDDESN